MVLGKAFTQSEDGLFNARIFSGEATMVAGNGLIERGRTGVSDERVCFAGLPNPLVHCSLSLKPLREKPPGRGVLGILRFCSGFPVPALRTSLRPFREFASRVWLRTELT